MYFVWISEQTVTFALYISDRLLFITEMGSFYCAVRTESLYNTDIFRLRKVNAEILSVSYTAHCLVNYLRGWNNISD